MLLKKKILCSFLCSSISLFCLVALFRALNNILNRNGESEFIVMFLILVEILNLTIEYDVSFCVAHIWLCLCLSIFSLYTICWTFSHERTFYIVKYSSSWIYWDNMFFIFHPINVLTHICIRWKHPCIQGINSPLSAWWMILYCMLKFFATILSIIFASTFIRYFELVSGLG